MIQQYVRTCGRLALYCVIWAVLPLQPAQAKVANAYPFDEPSDYLSPADAFDPWAAALANHREQHPLLYACGESGKPCRGRLRSFQRLMQRARTLTPSEQISAVHFYVNRTRYDDDHPQRIYDEQGHRVGVVRNHWASLYDFLQEGGDCEDFATAKYFMLRELGFAAEDLRIVVAHQRNPAGHHAVLAVRRPDRSIWLLDSDNQIRKRSHRGYRYIYGMNEHHVWDHRADYAGPDAASRDAQR